jgi:hypothetical protein
LEAVINDCTSKEFVQDPGLLASVDAICAYLRFRVERSAVQAVGHG